ncbi:MAG TPA: ABC transporter permease subunit, partial [Xanthomonadales bacterium]|nr:ABC transporter permease subunit [Xanthomonadales bacterium]
MRAVHERFPVVILAGATAELRARLRDRTTYVALFVMLVGVAMLFPGEGSGYATIVAGGRRVALTSTASAAVSAVLFNAFFSIVGLLAVSATLLRDSRPNGIGELLRTSPASNRALVAARWLANLALLAVFASVACVFALLIVWPRVAHMDVGAFVLCYAAIVAPVLLVLAGAGLVLDVFLRGNR